MRNQRNQPDVSPDSPQASIHHIPVVNDHVETFSPSGGGIVIECAIGDLYYPLVCYVQTIVCGCCHIRRVRGIRFAV